MVNLTWLFFSYHFRRLVRFWQARPLARSITTVLFLTVLVGVAIGVFFFTQTGFRLFQSDQFLKEAMTLYVYELFLLMVTYLIVVSALITGLYKLFRRGEDAWIIATPCFRTALWWHYLEVTFSATWPFLLIAVPGLLAAVKVFGLSLTGLGLSLVAVTLLSIFAVSATIGALFIIAKVLYQLGGQDRPVLTGRRLALISLFGLGVGSYLAWQQTAPDDLFKLFGVQDFTATQAEIAPVIDRFWYFPSHHAAFILFSLPTGDLGLALIHLLILMLLVVVALLLFWEAVCWFLPVWQTLQEGGFEARTQISKTNLPPTPFPRYLKGPLGVLLEKEAVLMFRNLRQLTWFGFLVSLWLMVTGFNLLLKSSLTKYQLSSLSLPEVIFALQIVILVYFISALTLRFAFPSFAMERNTAWIIGSAPLDLGKVFQAKLLFFGVAFSGLGLMIAGLNLLIFSFPPVQTGLFLLVATVATVLVTVLGVALGAIFPNFETDDPEILSTTGPGLAFVFGSLVYGGLVSAAYYRFLSGSGLKELALLVVFSLASVVWLFKITPRFLKDLEFK